MSNLRNIGGDQGDKFFRYKMPDIQSKVEKPGTNGQQTVILNIAEIAKAIKINPDYPTRFFGYELGAQASFMDTSDRTCAILKGIHPPEELRKLLEKFIAMFILCPTCKLPETRLSASKRAVTSKCASCGFNGALNHGHRLEKYIINHPPKKKKKDKDGAKKKKKDKRGKKKDQEEEPPTEAPVEEEPVLPEVETKTQWSVDVSAEAMQARRRALLEEEFGDESKAKPVGKVDITKPEQVLRAFVTEAKRDVHEIVSEVERLRLSHDLSAQERFRVLLEGLVDVTQPKKMGKQFKTHKAVLAAMSRTPSTKNMLISSIVRFLQDGLLGKLPIVLQALYEADVLDDTSIIAWHSSPPESDAAAVGKDIAVKARKKAKVFVDWLEASDDDED